MSKAAGGDMGTWVYEMQVRICKAFANCTRLRMLDMRVKREHSVADIQSELGHSALNISQHVAILKAAGVVPIPEVKQACGLIREVLRAQLRNGRKLVI